MRVRIPQHPPGATHNFTSAAAGPSGSLTVTAATRPITGAAAKGRIVHKSTAMAVATAQARRARTKSGYKQDLYDLALDELLRQPNRGGDPEHLLGNALANARKHQRRRADIATITPYGSAQDLSLVVDTTRRLRPGPGTRSARACSADGGSPLADAVDWLQRAPLTKAERLALERAATGEFIAGSEEASPTARQRLARARRSARTARIGVAW